MSDLPETTANDQAPQPGDIGALGLPVIPHLDQYVGPWAMEEGHFTGLVQQVSAMDLIAHMKSFNQQDGSPIDGNSERVGTTAVIRLQGPMTKFGSSLSALRGGTVGLRKSIRNAVRDKDIKAILLKVDSPGGAVAGVSDLADEVSAAAQKKPLFAFIEDMGASAAYFVASQATKIVANAGALIGSIGAFGVLYDYSAMFDKEGVKAFVIKAGEFKGIGVKGTEITESQRNQIQRMVDQINDLFVASIGRGRKMSVERVRELADGRIHIASEALRLGLVDKIGTFEEALAELGQATQKKKGLVMSQENTETTPATPSVPVKAEPVAASFHQIKEACPGADTGFICAQLEGKATAEQAGKAWMSEQTTRLQAAQEDLKNAKAKADKPGLEPVGTVVVKGDADGASDEATKWKAAVNAKVAAGMSRQRACSAVNREHPGLREAFVAETNHARQVA